MRSSACLPAILLEEPSDVVAVGLMTDPGDEGSRRRGFYGDITLRSGP